MEPGAISSNSQGTPTTTYPSDLKTECSFLAYLHERAAGRSYPHLPRKRRGVMARIVATEKRAASASLFSTGDTATTSSGVAASSDTRC